MKYVNPYEDLTNGYWVKVNFHAHAGTGEGTCGSYTIDFVRKMYKELGYGALCISNHDLYTDSSSYDDEEMFMVQGVEYSQDEHMLTIGVNKSFHELPHQGAIDETAKMNGFTILCHPNWIKKEYWPWKKIDKLSGFKGLEIMNMLIYRLSGSGRSTDTWDYLLKQGKLVFGFGNDDFHLPFDAGRSFTHIYVNGSGYEEMKKAVDKGRFTASTGLALESLELHGSILKVGVKFLKQTYIDTFRYCFISENGLILESYGKTAEYKITDENYIRIEAIAENGAMLFTQPVYKKDFMR